MDSRDVSTVDLFTIIIIILYAFGSGIYFLSWHQERTLLRTSAHEGQETERLKKMGVSS